MDKLPTVREALGQWLVVDKDRFYSQDGRVRRYKYEAQSDKTPLRFWLDGDDSVCVNDENFYIHGFRKITRMVDDKEVTIAQESYTPSVAEFLAYSQTKNGDVFHFVNTLEKRIAILVNYVGMWGAQVTLSSINPNKHGESYNQCGMEAVRITRNGETVAVKPHWEDR
jgi:hypothetical protein